MMKKSALFFIFVLLFASLSAGETPANGEAEKNPEESANSNRFNLNLSYVSSSGFYPSLDILWHYDPNYFSSIYGSYTLQSEKKSLKGYDGSKYASFSKTLQVGAEIFGFYALRQPAFIALSFGLEYKRIKTEEFGFYDIKTATVNFENDVTIHTIFPFLRLRADKETSRIQNNFALTFFPTYYLLMKQESLFRPILPTKNINESDDMQMPAAEFSDEFFIDFKQAGGLLISGNLLVWQAKYISTVLKQKEGSYSYGTAKIKQTFVEYYAALEYVIPFHIVAGIYPKLGIGFSGSTEFRENDGKPTKIKVRGYVLTFGFYY